MRLDNYLATKGLVQSRTKAQSIIKDSIVSVNGEVITKSSFKVEDTDSVVIKEYKKFVSRSAHKLDEFLSELNIDISGYTALDIGSSTGGFTQVLLERGAKEVSAVDVGKDQLHHTIKTIQRYCHMRVVI